MQNNIILQGNGIGVPIGTIITWPTSDWQTDMKAAGGKPDHFLLCNGQSVDSTKYPKLAKIMANVPNYQGLFLRGYGSQSFAQENGSLNGITTTTYSSNPIGSIQGDALRQIYGKNIVRKGNEGMTASGVLGSSYLYGESTNTGHNGYAWTPVSAAWIFDSSLVVATADENRPVNTSVIYLICAK